MSWHIDVYKAQAKTMYEALSTPDERDELFEGDVLPELNDEEIEVMKKHLERRGYRTRDGHRYEHEDEPGATATLRRRGLHFVGRGDGVMEVTMTASEFSSHFAIPKGMFAVWDMQEQCWV